MDSYKRKLKHPKWQRCRLKVLEAANWRCSDCGDTETCLHVHHLYYRRGREPWGYPIEAFEVVCERCHEFRHIPVSVNGCCGGCCGGCDGVDEFAYGGNRPCEFNKDRCFRYLRLFDILESTRRTTKAMIDSLNDHKGVLTVTWKNTPSQDEMDYMHCLWATIGGEDMSDDYIVHETKRSEQGESLKP